MTATVGTALVTEPTSTRRHPLLRATIVSAVAGAIATSAFAAAAHAAGVPFAIEGEQIPMLGFANLTVIGAVLGGLLLLAFNRFGNHPRRRFVETTAALTVVSCVPSVIMPPDTATKAALVIAHVLAAVIIVPILARAAA